MLLTIPYSESAYPITPVEPLKAILYDYFVISVNLFTLYSYNNNKFTYDKFKSVKLRLSILDMF